ncbi:MAG: radical SAM protein [Archaeoglobaceae archaeon]
MLSSLRLILKGIAQYVRGKPIILAHTISNKCNLKCPFCPFRSVEGEEMSREDIFDFLRKSKKLGILVYTVWGTEPLLREDLGECLEYARSLGMLNMVITNGTLLRDKLEMLKYCDYLIVSVDGVKTYPQIRGGDLDRVVEGIMMAKEAGIRTSINCVLNNVNLYDVDDLVDLAEELGVGIVFEPIHEYQSISQEVWEEYGIRDEQKYKQAVDRIIEMKRKGRSVLNSYPYLEMIREREPEFKCKVNDTILHLGLDGKVESCFGVIGDANEDLEELWKKWRLQGKQLSEKCEGCLFSGYVETSLLFNLDRRVIWNYLKHL